MELKDTIRLMNSSNHEDRFRAEYFQLVNRISGLTSMLEQYRTNTLKFTPKCSVNLLGNQLRVMQDYKTHLIERARIEEISLEEQEDTSKKNK